MTFMSIFDIISSLFIALGTIMMPSDCIFKFAGPMLGNKVTCQIQGWLTTCGLCGSTSLNACLAWYFVLKITFQMNANRVRLWFEPALYTYTMIIAILVPTFYLSTDFLNPTPYDGVCTISPYPESCDEDEWYDWKKCTWGDDVLKDYYTYKKVSVAIITLQCILVLICMSMILWTSLRTKHHVSDTSNSITDDADLAINSNHDIGDSTDRNVLIYQALMYIGALFLTWILTCIAEFFKISSLSMDLANCILFPLQGFWNLLIFLYDKTYLIRKGNKQISYWQATKMLITSPSKAPGVFLSNINVVSIELKHGDNILVKEKVSNKGSEYDGISEERESFSVPDVDVPDIKVPAITDFDSLSPDSSLNLNVLPLHEIRGIQYLGNGNRRFVSSHKCLRRTGEIEDNRLGRVAYNSAISIETPKGFVGDSINSSTS
jgi:hypothetical protein